MRKMQLLTGEAPFCVNTRSDRWDESIAEPALLLPLVHPPTREQQNVSRFVTQKNTVLKITTVWRTSLKSLQLHTFISKTTLENIILAHVSDGLPYDRFLFKAGITLLFKALMQNHSSSKEFKDSVHAMHLQSFRNAAAVFCSRAI